MTEAQGKRTSGLALTDGQELTRSYDVRVTPEIAELLRNKPIFDGGDDFTSNDRYPVAGIVEGVKKDSHIITSHPVGPKATTDRNEVIPFPQEKITRLGKSIAERVISENQSLFKEQDPESGNTKEQIVKQFLEGLLFEMAQIGRNELNEMEFGIEVWPSNIPLPEEQMRGVERRRGFMVEVARECINELMKNDTFRQFTEDQKACLDFSFSTTYSECANLTIWLTKPKNEEDRKDVIQITDHFEEETIIEIDNSKRS